MKELTLSEQQAMSLVILKAVHQFCQDNGIRYFMAYGTLLGAVRHKGFIPWDDDVDIIMPRPDYDRFCRSFRMDGYELISPETDPACSIPFARVVDTEKTLTRTRVPWLYPLRTTGIWIDIFPLDGATDDFPSHLRRYKYFHHQYRLSTRHRRLKWPIREARDAHDRFKTILNRIIHPHWTFASPIPYVRRMQKEFAKIPYGSTRHVAQLSCPDCENDWFLLSDFDAPVLLPFEDALLCAPQDSDKILTHMYGDYMQLPPEEKRVAMQNRYLSFFWKD